MLLLLVIRPSFHPFLLLAFGQGGRGRPTNFRGCFEAQAGGMEFYYQALRDWLPVHPPVETREVGLLSE